jgi:hypothetical protein
MWVEQGVLAQARQAILAGQNVDADGRVTFDSFVACPSGKDVQTLMVGVVVVNDIRYRVYYR